MANEIQGKVINFKVRVSGSGAPFKNMTCTEDTTYSVTNETSERRTNCGIKTSIADPTMEASGNAVHNVVPTNSEVSYNDVVGWQKTKTKLDYQYINDADTANGIAAGAAIFRHGSGYFTSSEYNGSAEADGIGSFSWTFSGTGNIDDYDNNSTS